jgi:hypothetical protein
VPLHKRGEGGFGIFPREFREQLVVIQFGHSPSNVRRTEKGTDYFQFFTQGRKGLLAHCSVGIEPPRTQNGNELPDEIYGH